MRQMASPPWARPHLRVLAAEKLSGDAAEDDRDVAKWMTPLARIVTSRGQTMGEGHCATFPSHDGRLRMRAKR
ncbi:hypothetical protein E2562_017203 [Oryza meyeriana var. granulata]|uniref:Uncharacterized protein n=1 Tax=Oryza meyeriana var. granulata TaxID=110450 RepID=A0A6G1ELT3_9ORYZ|nr:hypothetical protein E2562_017203 [Oryza meyeriana var. granulata]